MALIFVNRYFFPDHSATSQILSDLAFGLAKKGRRVTVITSRQRYDAPSVRLPARETASGVTILRIPTTRFGRDGLLGRAIDYVTFYCAAAWVLWRTARRGDIVIAMTGGGPGIATQMPATYVIDNINSRNVGHGMAAATCMLLPIAALVLIQAFFRWRASRRGRTT